MLTTNESLLVLQAFLILISMTVLPMAALTVDRRAALARERAARADADAALSARDEFLAILSHELRNPLAAISSAAAVLATGSQGRENRAELVASIRRQAQHLARLIDDLLDIGRMTASKLLLRKEPVELAGAVRRCVNALGAARGLPNGRIELALEAVWIDADPVRVTQIVENLLDNALKHTPAGKRIHVTVRDIGAVAELQVEDEGHGIRPELLPRVFEPFTQDQQGLDRSAGGLGLGLTLVRRLTELHHGTVEAHSSGANRGSRFVLRFPSRSAPLGAALAASPPAAPAARPRRLLIVEDNVDARTTLRALLEALGHEVDEAADGEAGIAAALERRPQLVFVDIGLPRLDGYEVARRLRAASLDARLVALVQPAIEIDDALDEFRREGAHAAIVEQIDAGRLPRIVLEHRVVAEMRVAVNHAVVAERIPPGAEHGAGDLVALFERPVGVVEQLAAVEPGHGEEPLGGELREHLWHADERVAGEDQPIETRVARLEIVIELFAQARGDLLQHLRRLDRGTKLPVDGEQYGELFEIGFDRRLHVRILQFGGESAPVMGTRSMHLAQRG